MTDDTVKVSIDDDIASIILDRAEVRNALNRDTMAQLRDAALAFQIKISARRHHPSQGKTFPLAQI